MRHSQERGRLRVSVPPLDYIEQAFYLSGDRLLSEYPPAGEDGTLQDRLMSVEGAIMAGRSQLDRLLDALTEASGPSPRLRERVAAMEKELEELEEERRGLMDKIAASAGPLVERRVKDLGDALRWGPKASEEWDGVEEWGEALDREEVNRLMQQVFSRVEVVPPPGSSRSIGSSGLKLSEKCLRQL